MLLLLSPSLTLGAACDKIRSPRSPIIWPTPCSFKSCLQNVDSQAGLCAIPFPLGPPPLAARMQLSRWRTAVLGSFIHSSLVPAFIDTLTSAWPGAVLVPRLPYPASSTWQATLRSLLPTPLTHHTLSMVALSLHARSLARSTRIASHRNKRHLRRVAVCSPSDPPATLLVVS